MLKFTVKGDLNNTIRSLKRMERLRFKDLLDKYGRKGVAALEVATPTASGRTASSWYYEIQSNRGGMTIEWKNEHVNKGISVALIIQLGHGTKNGGYVRGINYINPALKPIFDEMGKELWREVTRL